MTINTARLVLAAALSFACFQVAAAGTPDTLGEEKFKALCAMCHINGGNAVNPKKTLHKADRESNNIKTADDIVRLMRNPGPGMTKFPEKYFPNEEAQKIAEYVLKTFN